VKKIVLITTGQPSTNPRIVKEADALQGAGFDVTVLYSFFINWAEETDRELLKRVSWKYKMAGGSSSTGKARYWYSRLRTKLSGILSPYFGSLFSLAERSQARSYDELLREAKKIKADWYIAHNLGALPIAVKTARLYGGKAGFDFEDYHRGEIDMREKRILKRVISIENKYVPSLDYMSTASELITDAVKKDHPYFKGKVITLLNCFPLDQQPAYKEKRVTDNSLQLFWFSQTIGINRGLEVLISALKLLRDPSIHITLAGRCTEAIMQYIETNATHLLSNIHFAGIISPEELPSFASKFDVGMAIEIPAIRNRDICLTNKIFTYLLAGNAIICSRTSMQSAFNEQYKVGESFMPEDGNELADCISTYKNVKKLNEQKQYNYALASKLLNWENESKKLLAAIG
jgi:glycosyltransferase involved in cell wall biosynthesis